MRTLTAFVLAFVAIVQLTGCQSTGAAADGRYATHDRGTVYGGSGYGRWAP